MNDLGGMSRREEPSFIHIPPHDSITFSSRNLHMLGLSSLFRLAVTSVPQAMVRSCGPCTALDEDREPPARHICYSHGCPGACPSHRGLRTGMIEDRWPLDRESREKSLGVKAVGHDPQCGSMCPKERTLCSKGSFYRPSAGLACIKPPQEGYDRCSSMHKEKGTAVTQTR